MEVYSSPSSPFVRKVRVLAIETGLADKIEFTDLAITPVAPNDTVNAQNPIGKIPTLVLGDGNALYDSRVICEYLDTQHSGTKMFPEQPEVRWVALRLQSIGDGIMESGVLMRFDLTLRPEEYRWKDWYGAQEIKVTRALAALDANVADLKNAPDIGTISVACALGYLDFRFSELINWRQQHPALVNWFEPFNQRPSMQSTMPSG